MLLSDDAHFSWRRTAVAHGNELDAGSGSFAGQHAPPIVVAGEGDERRAAAERGDVGRGIGSAAQDGAGRRHREHRHRRLRRQSRAVTGQILVEHHVTEDEHVVGRKAVDNAAQNCGHRKTPGDEGCCRETGNRRPAAAMPPAIIIHEEVPARMPTTIVAIADWRMAWWS